MLFAVIDIGSNSVRLMLNDGKQTLYKKIQVTKLARGMNNGQLSKDSVERTIRAVSFFVNIAKQEKVDKIYIYATAAVRNAVNQKEFLCLCEKACGVKVDVISGERESFLGALGAVNGGNGGIIDVGGASSEIAVMQDSCLKYGHSLSIGAVKLTDLADQDYKKAQEIVAPLVKEYGEVPISTFYAIGGTATTIVAILQELEVYDAKKVHGYKVELKTLESLVERLYQMTVEQRKGLKGLQPERADVIASGALILLNVMKYLNIQSFYVSESDNLEGYLISKMENL